MTPQAKMQAATGSPNGGDPKMMHITFKHHDLTFYIDSDGWGRHTTDEGVARRLLAGYVTDMPEPATRELHAALVAHNKGADYPDSARSMNIQAELKAAEHWVDPDGSGNVYLMAME